MESEVKNRPKQIREAFLASLPVMAGYVVLGTGFGILMNEKGYGVLWTLAMSVFIYAGSLQFAGVGMITSSASVISAAVTSIMVNARHLFYSISMLGKYKDAGRLKPYMIFALTDETYSMLSAGDVPEGCDPHFYRFMVSLFNHSYWITGSVLGSLLGRALPFSTSGIEFSMTALFAASFAEQWMNTTDHFSALTGLLSSLVCLLFFGPSDFLIPSMILIIVILSVFRKKGDTG